MKKESTRSPQANKLKAIALSYGDPKTLPTVLVSGQDELARLIIEVAQNANVPVQENKELVSLLDKQSQGPVISSRALKVLAEVIAFLYHTDTLWKSKHPQLSIVLK